MSVANFETIEVPAVARTPPKKGLFRSLKVDSHSDRTGYKSTDIREVADGYRSSDESAPSSPELSQDSRVGEKRLRNRVPQQPLKPALFEFTSQRSQSLSGGQIHSPLAKKSKSRFEGGDDDGEEYEEELFPSFSGAQNRSQATLVQALSQASQMSDLGFESDDYCTPPGTPVDTLLGTVAPPGSDSLVSSKQRPLQPPDTPAKTPATGLRGRGKHVRLDKVATNRRAIGMEVGRQKQYLQTTLQWHGRGPSPISPTAVNSSSPSRVDVESHMGRLTLESPARDKGQGPLRKGGKHREHGVRVGFAPVAYEDGVERSPSERTDRTDCTVSSCITPGLTDTSVEKTPAKLGDSGVSHGSSTYVTPADVNSDPSRAPCSSRKASVRRKPIHKRSTSDFSQLSGGMDIADADSSNEYCLLPVPSPSLSRSPSMVKCSGASPTESPMQDVGRNLLSDMADEDGDSSSTRRARVSPFPCASPREKTYQLAALQHADRMHRVQNEHSNRSFDVEDQLDEDLSNVPSSFLGRSADDSGMAEMVVDHQHTHTPTTFDPRVVRKRLMKGLYLENPYSPEVRARRVSSSSMGSPQLTPVKPSRSRAGSFMSKSTTKKVNGGRRARMEYTLQDAEANITFSRFMDDFEILSTLGRGSFGVVYSCRKRLDGITYAVKCTKRQRSEQEKACKIMREVQVISSLSHPNVVRYFNSWVENEFIYMQAELCDKGALSSRVCGEKLSEDELKAVLVQMLRALDYLHDLDIVHLDVKPENIYATSSGSYKLGDFGLADYCNQQQSLEMEGDSRYLSRDLLEGDTSELKKADIFALGVSMYELSTQHAAPSRGDEWHAIRDGKLSHFPEDMSPEMLEIIRDMIRENPADRPSAAELLRSPYLNNDPVWLRKELDTVQGRNNILEGDVAILMRKVERLSMELEELRAKSNAQNGFVAGAGDAAMAFISHPRTNA